MALHLGANGSAHAEVIAREDAVHRTVEADVRIEGLAAPAGVGAAHEDVVDAPVRLAQIARERIEATERRAIAAPHVSERIRKVDALAAERTETFHVANLVGVGGSVEIAHDNGRKSVDGRDPHDVLGDGLDLRLTYVSLVKSPVQMGDEKRDRSESYVELGKE